MVELSSLPVKSHKSPEKLRFSGRPEADFRGALDAVKGQSGSRKDEHLPEGGKDLPVALPLAIASARMDYRAMENPASELGTDTEVEADPAKSLGTAISMIATAANGKPVTDEGQDPGSGYGAGQPRMPGFVRAGGDRHADPRVELPATGAQAVLVKGELPPEAHTQQAGQQGAEPLAKAGPTQPASDSTEKASLSEVADQVSLRTKAGNSPASANGPNIAVSQIVDLAGPDTAGKAGSQAFNQPQAVRPQDFATLVNMLVEARDSGRGTSAHLSIVHSDFGAVKMHFSQHGGDLHVSLANADPEFARSVSAALPTDASKSGDTLMHHGQKDGGQQQLFARADTSNPGSSAQTSGGQFADAHRQSADDRASRDVPFVPSDEAESRELTPATRRQRGGIFA